MTTKTPKVLIVDDSPTVVAVLGLHLERAGFIVATHNRAFGTLMAVLKEKPCIILLDVAMPSISGDEICKLIKKEEAGAQALIFFYSSLNEEALKQKVAESGADGYLHKNWSPELVVETLHTALGISN